MPARFDLYRQIRPFHRCLDCNGVIQTVQKSEIVGELQPLTRRYYHEFYRCVDGFKIYWKGTHYEHMQRKLGNLITQKL